jgi:nitrate/nitrite transporter NarK
VSDPTDLTNIGVTGGAGALGATLVGLLLRAIIGKQGEEVATKLAVIEAKLETLIANVEKHDNLADRITKLEVICSTCPGRAK